ncbi:hypothetical protein G5V58_25270 [Nocardioides anomalus]|uniref:Uncharacterized protein n=1 Tax=Nocardioides anomalus TaxID=2712223 RepID=A0A6G6WK50_9ACTN|nr:hypothetical protein [Nocardioides anomalus]QIG45609.1 hypothetical protein G5V58_25270 [Nocardioides anomalus]
MSELQRQLAEAAAQVAHVQAQLTVAQGGVAPTAGAPPSTPVPAVPYGAPHAFTVMGQPVDVSSYLSPQATEQLRSSLQALGLGHSALFGGMAGPPAPPEPVAPLADPPRRVPLSFRLATFDLSWYELFLLVILTAAPIAVWVYFPVVVPAALLLAVAVIAAFRGRRYARRIGMLKWGKAATVTHSEVLTQGTYYGGLTYNNMRKRTARGWDVSTIWYSGPAYTNKIDYTLDGVAGSLTYRGLLYTNGVVLADSRDPSRALCVVEYPYSVKPGPDGQLTGEVSLGRWVGIAVTVFVEALVVVLAVEAVVELWLR